MFIGQIIDFFTDLFITVRAALPATVSALRSDPLLLFRVSTLRRVIFTHIWAFMSDGVNENGKDVKIKLITPHAYGVVLDIGAGFGATMPFLDQSKIKKYIALEPNVQFHEGIRRTAASVGFSEYDGTLEIVSLTADQAVEVLSEHSIDTIVSVLTLCSIPRAEKMLPRLVQHTLKPGGTFLYYEHVDSPVFSSRILQRLLSPFWSFFFDGCTLGLPSYKWVAKADDWEESELWNKEAEENDSLFWHKVGRFVRKKGADSL